MKRFFRSPWFWLGVVALIGLIIWFFIPAYCFGGVFLWGVEAVVGVYLLLRRLSGKHPKAARRLRRAFTVCVALGLMAMSFTAGLIAQAGHGSPAVSCPVLIVPGAAVYGEQPSLALQERLTAALAYLQAHPETICIVSGGQGQGENITEAQCSYRWLTAHGIEESRLLLEEDSTSTQENLIYSMERSAAAGVSLEQPVCVAVASSEYHLYRIGQMGKDLGMNVVGVPAKTMPLLSRLHYGFREIIAIWYYWIFE